MDARKMKHNILIYCGLLCHLFATKIPLNESILALNSFKIISFSTGEIVNDGNNRTFFNKAFNQMASYKRTSSCDQDMLVFIK